MLRKAKYGVIIKRLKQLPRMKSFTGISEKKMSDKLNERAANIIIEELSKHPCDKGNNK